MDALFPILVTLPISGFDSHIAVEMLEWMADETPCPNHPCLVVYCDDVPQSHRERIDAAVKRAFLRQYWFSPILPVAAKGWPLGPNYLFQAVANFCENKCMRAWFFMEPDMTPLVPGWMDLLEAEYNLHVDKYPFYGVIQQSWSPDRQPRDFHMVGCGIYPRHLALFTRKHLGHVTNAFDVAMQNDLVGANRQPAEARLVWHTNQIAHRWLSQNYHRGEDGAIHCDPSEGRLPGQKAFAIATPIPDCAVLVHGCKDSSLVRLLRKEKLSNTAGNAEIYACEDCRKTVDEAGIPATLVRGVSISEKRKRGRPRKVALIAEPAMANGVDAGLSEFVTNPWPVD